MWTNYLAGGHHQSFASSFYVPNKAKAMPIGFVRTLAWVTSTLPLVSPAMLSWVSSLIEHNEYFKSLPFWESSCSCQKFSCLGACSISSERSQWLNQGPLDRSLQIVSLNQAFLLGVWFSVWCARLSSQLRTLYFHHDINSRCRYMYNDKRATLL